MKISEVTGDIILDFIKADKDEQNQKDMQIMMSAAKSYIQSYTGILAENKAGESLDDYEDLTIAYMVICQDMFDNRSFTVDSKEVNRVIDSIMSIHSRNLVG